VTPQSFSEIVKKLRESGSLTWEGIHNRKDGTSFPVEVNIRIVNLEKEYMVTVARDISLRKQNEESVLKLSRAVEQSPASVIITDRKGIIEYINPKLTEITGYKNEEVLGKNPRIFSSGEKPKSEYKILWENIISGKEWKGEFHNKKKNGELYWEYAHISPIINLKGEITHFVAIKEDITERKKMIDELILAKEKAEESDLLKSAFLANMSHEIRTPMNGILGFTSLLLEPELSDETKEAYIQIIHQSGERMLNTVTDIVEISKIEAGIVEVKNSMININKGVESILNFFQPQAQKKGLLLSFENGIQETNLFTKTDKNKFDSIFTNLIKNAIKYTDKGKITVSTCINNGFIEICIKDTGIGVPKHRKEAIFNRFEQADIADARVFEGSGLGLAIAKSYVEILGGKIWVESIVGEGSQFYFSIPLVPVEKENTNTSKKENTNNKLKLLGQINILIVEDDEVSAIFLKTILKDIARKIIHAKTGEQAIEECKTNVDFDIILMDIKMPEMNGYEATQQIRQFNKNVVIIAQTAFGLSGDKEKAIQAGCNDYISKPINKEELNKIIQKYFKT
jgi:PAS domain S-box-containing protein